MRRGPDEIARNHAAERSGAWRLEGKLLARFRNCLLDVGKRRAGTGFQNEFLGLIELDAGEAREIEGCRRLHGAAEAALGARAHQFERPPGGRGIGDRFAQFTFR